MRQQQKPLPSGPIISPQGAQDIKKFNRNLRYIQGTRLQLNASGTTSLQISLNASGIQFLGFTIVPASGLLTTLADTQVTLMINNNSLVLNASANNTNPNFVSNMIFFPTPQPLFGNDNIQMTFNKNDANAVFVTANIFYIPRAAIGS